MKILVITNKMPYPPKDGGSIATFTLAYNLSHFAEIHILAINTSKHFYDAEKIPSQITKKITFHTVNVNTDIKIPKLLKNLFTSKLPYNAERFINSDFEKKLIQILENNKFDIIQCEGLYVLPYINIIKKYHKAKIAYRAHNIESEIWKRTMQLQKNPLKKAYTAILANRIEKMEKDFINRYDFLIPITDRDKKILNEKFGNTKPALTTPTGINISDYPINKRPAPNTLFYIGALDWIPNQEGLLWFFDKVWNKLISQHPDIKLHIAGRNAPAQFEKIIKAQKNVIYHGEIKDAKDFMQSYEIMIVPLFSGSGMRIKIIEGMALAKPIVTTPIGAEGINAQHNKNIFITPDNNEFINIIEKILSDKKISHSIGEQARLFVSEKFDNFALAKRIFEFYENYQKTLI